MVASYSRLTTTDGAEAAMPKSTQRAQKTERALRHKDGSVLLSVHADQVFRLNGVGALTWLIIEEVGSPFKVDYVVHRLHALFEEINSEGEVYYDVSPEQLSHDTGALLEKLCGLGVLVRHTDLQQQTTYAVAEGVTGTTGSPDPVAEPLSIMETAEAGEQAKMPKREIVIAFLVLAAVDLLLKFAGFETLVRRIERWPIRESRISDPNKARSVCAAVDRAQMYYPRKAMCLQRSAAVTFLLRHRGVPAVMVLAAQEFPPKAHAWVEVGGVVVNDSKIVKGKYRELRRL